MELPGDQKVEFDYSTLWAEGTPLAEISGTRLQEQGLAGGHLLYRIQLRSRPEQTIERRFSDFVALQARLRELDRSELLPGLPPKQPLKSLGPGRRTAEKNRLDSLELYLNKLLSNDRLISSEEARAFFSAKDGWAGLRSADKLTDKALGGLRQVRTFFSTRLFGSSRSA